MAPTAQFTPPDTHNSRTGSACDTLRVRPSSTEVKGDHPASNRRPTPLRKSLPHSRELRLPGYGGLEFANPEGLACQSCRKGWVADLHTNALQVVQFVVRRMEMLCEVGSSVCPCVVSMEIVLNSRGFGFVPHFCRSGQCSQNSR